MRVRLQPADRGGCGFYRLRWPAQVLAEMGCDLNVPEVWPQALCERSEMLGEVVRHVDADCDVMVFQRPMEGKLLESFPALRRQGIAIVVEIDDDFHALPAGHPARRDTAPMWSPAINRRFLRQMCAEADLVTCTTQALADRYAPHGRYRIIPNFVPAAYLSVQPAPHEGTRVGWTGSTRTHIDDLRVCGTGVRDALRSTGASFHVIGTGVGVAEQLQLDDEPTSTGWVEIDDYPREYAGLDVAIVPLQPNPFNEAKSYLKGLEAMALGVPFIASPTTPYRNMRGVHATAGSPEGWEKLLRIIIENDDYRAHIAAEGRQAASHQTIEANAWRWWEAWEQAVNNARGRAAA